VAFGPLATAKGTLAPGWDATTLSCGNTYCHGAFRSGNASYAPVWTSPRATACGTCHGVPPLTDGHPNNADCGSCHPGYTATTINAASHLNGRLDASITSCTGCHGDAGRAATVQNPQLPAAPPFDASGNAVTTARGVGAHLAHLGAGPLSAALPCTECHVVPQLGDGSHPSGAVELTWGPLATAGSTPATGSGLTCTNYCHGASLQGGTLTSPAWTQVDGTQAACGTCHGLPPAAYPSVAHPRYVLPAPRCSGCHPATTAATTDTILAGGGAHVNGTAESTFAGHPTGWVDPADTVCGGIHGCLPPPAGQVYTHFAYFGPCTTCHGDGFDFTPQGGSSGVGCSTCHLNAFDNVTCVGMGTQAPCSCDLCHTPAVVVIPK
jgi:predicted CxxxxCH...CXXCH cytochrome family protein